MKMNRYLQIGVAALIGLQSSIAFAQREGSGSHGGNAVVCFTDPSIAAQLTPEGRVVSKTIPDRFIPFVKSVKTLELYELEAGVYGLNRASIEMREGETEDQFFNRVVDRFSGWTPVLKDIVEAGKKIIGNRVQMIDDETLIPVEDIRPMTRAKNGCVYTNVAQQGAIGSSPIKRLVIDKRLFPKASTISRVVLMIHEYVLAYLTHYLKHEDSEGTRNIVARMLAKDVDAAEMKLILETFGVRHRSLNAPNGKVVPTGVANLLNLIQTTNEQYGMKIWVREFSSKKDFLKANWSEVPAKSRRHQNIEVFSYFFQDAAEGKEVFDLRGRSVTLKGDDLTKMKALYARYQQEEETFAINRQKECLTAEKAGYEASLIQANASVNASIISDGAKARLRQGILQLELCGMKSLRYRIDSNLDESARFNASELHFEY